MHFETYDYINGDILDRIDVLDFGDILQNQHSIQPMVFRAFSDSTAITNLEMYLEDKGSWSDSEFGYYISSSFVTSVESGSSVFSHFTLVPDATATTTPGNVPIGWDITSSFYVWLDAQIADQTGITNANYRFFYNF